MFFRYIKWALLWAMLILILCGIPGKDIPHISFLELLSFDKFVHAILFFVLILLTIRGFVLQTNFIQLRAFPRSLAIVICMLYGILIEWMQATLFEDRTADALDVIANSFGCIMGILFYNYFEKKYLVQLIK